MEEANDLIDEKRFFDAAKNLKRVDAMLQEAADADLNNVDEDQKRAFAAARSEFATADEKVQYALGKEWDSRFTIEETRNAEEG